MIHDTVRWLSTPVGYVVLTLCGFAWITACVLWPERRALKFGREVLRDILNDRLFFETEQSEEWCALLAKYGYVERVAYDPSAHGSIDHADAGDEIWFFTGAMRADAAPADASAESE